MWCVAELDDDYIARMEDVLASYEKPYRSSEPVICLDEKPVSLHDDVRPGRPSRPGHIAKRDNEYKRCGTANLFAVVEPKAGRHFNCATPTTPNLSAAQFALVVQRLVAAYPFARKIHLVMDNLNIHCCKSLTDYLGAKEGRYIWRRLKVHYTPTHGSCLNQAELELSLVSRQCLGTRRIPNLENLLKFQKVSTTPAIPACALLPPQVWAGLHLLSGCLVTSIVRAWNAKANRDRTCIDWKFSRKDTRTKFGYTSNLSKRSQT